MTPRTIKVTTAIGKVLNVTLSRDGLNVHAQVEVSGRRFGGHAWDLKAAGDIRDKAIRDRMPANATHCWLMLPLAISLTAAQAEEVRRELAAAQAEIDELPEVRPQRLRQRRRDLMLAYSSALDEAQRLRNRAWERGNERRGVAANKHDRTAEDIAKELAEFDAAHPEVLAQIRAEHEAKSARGAWD